MFEYPSIDTSWKKHLNNQLNADYMNKLKLFLQAQDEPFFPPRNLIFNALNITKFNNVKVVILGQDPYHNNGQAMGMSFSVPHGIKIPPSLKNIYREIEEDLAILMPSHGDLSGWAKQGVLLLNAVLTVKPHKPASHARQGWEIFTDEIINCINKKTENTVFILWGAYAGKKYNLINDKKHLVLTGIHPSPLSSHRGFFGCKHFSKTNKYLNENGKNIIEWDKL